MNKLSSLHIKEQPSLVIKSEPKSPELTAPTVLSTIPTSTVDPIVPEQATNKPEDAFIVTEEEAAAENYYKPGTYVVLEDHGYFISSKIGSGSFAKVKKARSQQENCTVAIKLVSKARAPSDYLTKFLPREISVVRGLNHVNIITYYRCIETSMRIYIIMQYAENGSLLELIRKEKQIEELRTKQIYRQLLRAIAYCHSKGIVHRDIKCENILFDRFNTLKLIDFGFARKYLLTDENQLSDTYCGSYAYACPQILKGIPYNPHFADIWASGVVLYAMAFGRLPYDDSSFPKLIRQVHNPINLSTKNINPITDYCKQCILRILSPKKQCTMEEVQQDFWLL